MTTPPYVCYLKSILQDCNLQFHTPYCSYFLLYVVAYFFFTFLQLPKVTGAFFVKNTMIIFYITYFKNVMCIFTIFTLKQFWRALRLFMIVISHGVNCLSFVTLLCFMAMFPAFETSTHTDKFVKSVIIPSNK